MYIKLEEKRLVAVYMPMEIFISGAGNCWRGRRSFVAMDIPQAVNLEVGIMERATGDHYLASAKADIEMICIIVRRGLTNHRESCSAVLRNIISILTGQGGGGRGEGGVEESRSSTTVRYRVKTTRCC